MKELKKLNEEVKEILKNDLASRNSDTYLYYQVIKRIGEVSGVNIEQVPLKDFLLLSSQLHFPPFESISRARRKMQSNYPDLRGNEYVSKRRVEKEEEYFLYYQK